MNPPSINRIKTSELEFDPKNPRFYRLNQPHSTQSIIEEMLDDEGVQDLMSSIGQKGYFDGEPLLVTKENGQFIVVEGNRRLAAVKLLNGELLPPQRRLRSVTELQNDAVCPHPAELPCIEYPTRKDVMRYLGYRHITGIKEWDPLSKAKYLADIREQFHKNLRIDNQMRALAKDIGSRSDYVAKLLTALGLYTIAENEKFFKLPMTQKDIEFSYLTTALGYPKITEWLGLDSGTDTEMKNLNKENLKRIFAWMFSKDQQGYTIIGESRNISKLADIVSSNDAITMLQETGKINEAYLYTEGPQAALENILQEAIQKTQIVWNMLPRTTPLTQNHLGRVIKSTK